MSNTFGKIFKITTFGESHGKIIGIVINGCPSNIKISENEINLELKKRRPNSRDFVSKRNEIDKIKILCGVYEKKTTGAPICMIIENKDVKLKSYREIKNIFRPSHGNFTYFHKYKTTDPRAYFGASARETALRVAAGFVAKEILKNKYNNIFIAAYVKSIGDISADIDYENLKSFKKSPVFCPDKKAEKEMLKKLLEIEKQKDSIGGVVEFYIQNPPIGLGEPIFDKLSSKLAYGMMSIPGSKGFEIGDGFGSVKKKGSQRNDIFYLKDDKIVTKTNNEGGILAGISSGMPIIGRVAFKPTATIGKELSTLSFEKKDTILKYRNFKRNDTCIAIRASRVVEAMCSLILVDFVLLNKVDCFK